MCKTVYTLTCSGVHCGIVGMCARQFTRSHVVGWIVVSWVCVQDNLHTHKQSGGLLYRGYVCKTIYTLTCSGVDCSIVGTSAIQFTHSHAVGCGIVGTCARQFTRSHVVGWIVVSWVRVQDNLLTCSGEDCGIVGMCARQHAHVDWVRVQNNLHAHM